MKRMSDINNNNRRPLGRLTTIKQVEKHEYTYYKHYDTPLPPRPTLFDITFVNISVAGKNFLNMFYTVC